MSKPVITRLFLGGIVAFVAGILLAIVALMVGFGGGVFVLDGPDVIGLEGTGTAWAVIGLIVTGGLAIVGGAIAGLVAWVGALLNTVQLADKTWFVLLLVLGLLSFGFIAMIAYVIAGPDGTSPQANRTALPA
jgi:hypothetical protein